LKKYLPFWGIGFFVFMDILSVAMGERDRVAHWAHIGGFVCGLVIAKLTYTSVLQKNPLLRFLNEKMRPGFFA